jgi:hypothetical protein
MKILPLLIVLAFTFGAGTARSQTPKTAEEYNNRGFDRQNSGDLEGAIADYTKAIASDTRNSL